MIKTLSQKIINIHQKPTNLVNGIYNTFYFNNIISNDIKYEILYKECLDKNRKKPIDRYISSLLIHNNKNVIEEKVFIFENNYNPKENYTDHIITCNNKKISIDMINPILLRKINTFGIVNKCIEELDKIKTYKNEGKNYDSSRTKIISLYNDFCLDLEKSPITKGIGTDSKKLLYNNNFSIPRIEKNFEVIKPIFDKWSKITGKELLIDRQFNLFCDFILLG